MLGALFVPTQGSKLMVVASHSADQNSIYSLLDGTEARLVDSVSARRFIIDGNEKGLVQKLYQNGAFLVLKAPEPFGCSAPLTVAVAGFANKEV